MSVSAQETVFHYVGNGVTVTFAFNCQVLLATDLNVYVDDALISSGFGVSGIGSLTGGSVTFDSAPASQVAVRLERVVTLERTTDYQQNGDFLARVVNPDFNRIWMAMQQHLTILGRALKVPKSDAAAPNDLPKAADRANKLLSFDVDGNPVAIAPAAQSATALQTLLASAAGATLVNGTWLGGVIANISAFATSIGASLIGTIQAASEIFKTRSIQDKLRDEVLNALDLTGVLGNSDGTTGNGNDDTAGLQAGLDYLGSIGGGTLRLTKATGAYRITSGLKMPSFVTIEGPSVDRYPYNSAAGATYLYADFTNPLQWVIEPKTTVGGSVVAYNAYIAAFPSGPTYNCAVRNLQVRANTSATPVYGGIRMHGCPGSVVDNVSVVNTGTGLFVNECYGGSYLAHFITYYYGFVGWQEANANDFNFYATSVNSATKVVPAGYVPTFLSALSATLTTTYNLSTNAHYNRCFGAVLGADLSTNSVSSTGSITVEGFSGGLLQLGSTGTSFQRFYVEGAAGQVDYTMVAAKSAFTVASLHGFNSASGALFDIGSNCFADIAATGLFSYSSFGTIYLSSTTTVVLTGTTAAALGVATPQYNLIFRDDPGPWQAPALINGWVDSSMASGFRKNGQTGNTELQGTITTGALNTVAYTLPAGYRSNQNKYFAVNSNNGATLSSVLINTGGQVIPLTGLPSWGISLDGIQFKAEA